MELKIQRSDKFQVPLTGPEPIGGGSSQQKSSNLQVQVPPMPARKYPGPGADSDSSEGGQPPLHPPTGSRRAAAPATDSDSPANSWQ